MEHKSTPHPHYKPGSKGLDEDSDNDLNATNGSLSSLMNQKPRKLHRVSKDDGIISSADDEAAAARSENGLDESKFPDSPSSWQMLRSTATLSPVSEEAFPVDKRRKYRVSDQELILDARYTPIKKINGASNASILTISAKDEKSDCKVTIKKFRGVFSSTATLDEGRSAIREIKILHHLNGHDNVVRLLDIINPLTLEQFDDLYLVLEYVQSNLASIIKSNNELSEDHIAYIVYQILLGLRHVHKARILHRDLCPANILINSACQVKIAEFSTARGVCMPSPDEKSPSSSSAEGAVESLDENNAMDELLTEYVTNRNYRAPEVMLSSNYGYPMDMWSVGCVLAELYNRQPLFQADDFRGQLEAIFHSLGTPSDEELILLGVPEEAAAFVRKFGTGQPAQEWQKLVPSAPASVHDLLSKLLRLDPSARLTCEEALKHPFFQKVVASLSNGDADSAPKNVVKQERKLSTPKSYVPKPAKPLPQPGLLKRKSEPGPARAGALGGSSSRWFDTGFEKLTRTKQNIQELVYQEIVMFRPACINRNPLEVMKQDPRIKKSRRMFHLPFGIATAVAAPSAKPLAKTV
eukprot:TRINITY_DN249_c0_g3_i1.p1 TRINITY_DN249_c0_g3~~TRINITY_DN249_c0_g3_i1.p1  ORF type:complete len:581 (+),score=130.71 TRINITY_DN249_c0_g3_i1:1755-3497(+)